MTVSSNDSVPQWERRWSEARVVRRARPDAARARTRLELAQLNVDRAKRAQSSADLDASLIFAEQALINAADAVLARDGYRVNSHVVRFGYPLLPTVYTAERALIDRIRSSRNTAQYEASGGVEADLATRATELAERAIQEVRQLIV